MKTYITFDSSDIISYLRGVLSIDLEVVRLEEVWEMLRTISLPD